DAKEMPGVRIAAVDAVAEDRHVRARGVRDHQQLVHSGGKSFQYNLGLKGPRVEEQNFTAHLLDRDQTAPVRRVGHRCDASLISENTSLDRGRVELRVARQLMMSIDRV